MPPLTPGAPLTASAPIRWNVTQTPNRLHEQFLQFSRSRADILQTSLSAISASQPLPSSSRTWAPRSSRASIPRHRLGSASSSSVSTNAALAATGDIHLYLDYMRSLSHLDELERRQRSRLVANFQSLSQEASLILQQRELVSRTLVVPSLTQTEMKAHEAAVVGLADTSQLAVAAQTVVTEVHRLHFSDLERNFDTNLELGLSSEEVVKRRAQHGFNSLTPPPSPSMIVLMFKELFTGFGPILMVAAVLCFLAWRPFGDPPDSMNLGLAIVIVLVIVLSSFFAFYQTRTSLSIITAFSKILPSLALVRRDGRDQSVLASDLVPGDVVTIKMGDKVPADVRLLSCDSLQVDNSALTGESEAVNCTIEASSDNFLESANCCFYSSLVIAGSAAALVINTGDRTVLGRVSSLTKMNNSHHSSHLESEIQRFVRFICSLAVCTAIICFVAWFTWLRVDHSSFLSTADFLTNVIGLVVAYLPTGLPLSLSLVLTFVARRMFQQRILVKNLSIVEDFNSVSLILSDKTGTLTINELTAVSVLWGQWGHLQVPICVSDNVPQLVSETVLSPVFQSMLLCALLCNSVEVTDSMGLPPEHPVTGDAVDVALYQLAVKYRLQLVETRQKHPRVRVLPFNSRNKYMITVHQTGVVDGEQLLAVIKGAPEFITRRCTRYVDDGGAEMEMTAEHFAHISAQQETQGSRGYRVIAIARQWLSASQLGVDHADVPQSSYTFLGLFCFIDPPREGVPAAISKSLGAGIRVAMVTGDAPSTASAIARQSGIILPARCIDTCCVKTDAIGRWTVEIYRDGQLLDSHTVGSASESNRNFSPALAPIDGSLVHLFDPLVPRANGVEQPPQDKVSGFSDGQWVDDGSAKECGIIITGSDMRCFDLAMWDFVTSHGSLVFARTSPEQKLKIVSEFQKRGDIVAVTGDGVNDAPAIKRANVGVAMQAGAEVAQEAADMVLLDNNFVSVVTAIETGRLVSDNLKKVTLYLLPAGSWSELLPILANFFLGLPLPLSAFLMVVICCLTDLCPSLALVNEAPENDIMKRKPIRRSDTHLVDWRLIFHAYALVGTIESFAAFLCWFWYFDEQGLPASALFFAFDEFTDGYHGKTQGELDGYMFTGQSIYFVALVIMQFFALLSTRTRYVSLFSHSPLYGPSRNLWLFGAMGVSSLIAIIITQVTFFNDTFHTRPVPVRFVMPALGFGGFLFLFDETRKRYVKRYPHSLAAKMAW